MAEIIGVLAEIAPLIALFAVIQVLTHRTFNNYTKNLTEQHNKAIEIIQKNCDDVIRHLRESKDKQL